MALKTKLNFVNQDRSGRIITLRDTTGKEVDGVTTGYGPTNGQVTAIMAYYFVLSRIGSNEDHVLKVDGSNPRLPSRVDIAGGADLLLTTDLFVADENTDIFFDGVLDLNMYVEFTGSSGVIITAGNNTITGIDFTETLKSDAIIVDGVIYQIDKLNSTDSILFIIGDFEEAATSFNILYRANTKALLMSMSENMHDYACDQMLGKQESQEWMKINIAASYRRAALGFFNANPADYNKANKLVQANFDLLKKYTIC